MAQLDGNAKVVKMLINNDLQNNVNGSEVEGSFFGKHLQ
jgi:tyrosine-protein phosphatase YwqE